MRKPRLEIDMKKLKQPTVAEFFTKEMAKVKMSNEDTTQFLEYDSVSIIEGYKQGTIKIPYQILPGLGARQIKVIVLQLGNTDLTSPAGKLLLMMLAAVAEMERDLLVERTQAGLQRAKAEGKKLGRPSKTSAEQKAEIASRLDAGDSVSSLARLIAHTLTPTGSRLC
jgi:hypothetical protein